VQDTVACDIKPRQQKLWSATVPVGPGLHHNVATIFPELLEERVSNSCSFEKGIVVAIYII
jgi:hypothetical protein